MKVLRGHAVQLLMPARGPKKLMGQARQSVMMLGTGWPAEPGAGRGGEEIEDAKMGGC